MSQERDATITRLMNAFNARNVDGWMGDSTQDVEIESRFSAVGGMRYRGLEGVRAWWADLAEAWDPMFVEIEATAHVRADVSVLLITLHGKGRESGLALDEPVAHRWRWRGELLQGLDYMDRQEAELIVGAAQ